MSDHYKSITVHKASFQKTFRNTVFIIMLIFITILIMNLVSGCKSDDQKQTESLGNNETSENYDVPDHGQDEDESSPGSNTDAKSTSSKQNEITAGSSPESSESPNTTVETEAADT